MNIHGLLLGSAAVLATVSHTNAADAIVAAGPEPLEYVRVCDAFGTGYFYIPGTETCLKFGGYVRTDFRGGDPSALIARQHVLSRNGSRILDGGADVRSRFTLNLSTASDTEFGALKTYAEARFNVDDARIDNNDKLVLSFGYIDLGGLRVGLAESAFSTFVGFTGTVIADAIIPAGPARTTLLSYSFDDGNGFSGIVSLEDDENTNVTTYTFNADGSLAGTRVETRNNYAPNLAAGVGYTSGGFGLKLVGGYDGEASEGAVKARLDATVGSVTGFLMAGLSTDGNRVAQYTEANRAAGRRSVLGSNYYALWAGDWGLWAGFNVSLSPKIKLNAQVSYDESANFASVANVNFTVVPGFVITPEIAYAKIDDRGLPAGAKDDLVAGRIRFQRSF
ncbi:porin [Rhizobium sp. CFBP 8762]|uniref:porin n=1 Tax=Rhizobium sp. CFBP 8762 TaxID=2775279 RepID=UPI0017866EBC|nr:porin [Rhizobium sp. CFBP 8762]MBD8554517.1 porin [Rhizobium sp. CFBP 8762]